MCGRQVGRWLDLKTERSLRCLIAKQLGKFGCYYYTEFSEFILCVKFCNKLTKQQQEQRRQQKLRPKNTK